MQVVGNVDPRINLDAAVTEHVNIVAQNTRKYSVTFPSTYQTGNMTLAVNVAPNSIISRTAYIQNTFQFTFNGTNTTGGASSLIVPGDGFNALRFLPLQQCCNSVQLSFNGLSLSTQSNEEIDYLCRCLSKEDKATWMSGGLSLQDTTQTYADTTTLGQDLNPLANLGNRTDFCSRGGYAYQIVSNTTSKTVLNVTWWEPIVCPPFLPNPKSETNRKGFAHLTQLQFQFVLTGDFTRMWCHDPSQPNVTLNLQSNANPGIVAVMTAQPILWLTMTQPNNLAAPIPRHIVYETWKSNPMISGTLTPAAVASGGALGVFNSGTLVSIPTFSVSCFPDLIFIYFRPTPSYRTYATSDTYAQISNIQIDLDTRANLLAECTTHDLYQISVANGLNCSFQQWQRCLGSLVILSAKDLGMSMTNAAGVLGAVQLTIRAYVSNISGVLGNTYAGSASGPGGSTYTGALYYWGMNSSRLSVTDGMWKEETSYLSHADVQSAINHTGGGCDGEGGGIWDALKSVYNAARPGLHRGLNALGPWGSVASSTVKALGGKRRYEDFIER